MSGRRLSAAALLLGLAAASPPTSDRAGNRLEPFAAVTPAPTAGSEAAGWESAVHCTADRRWCAQLRHDGEGEDEGRWRLHLFAGQPGPDAVSDRPLVLAGQEDRDAGAAFSPQAVRAADGSLLIGVRISRSTSFSGGGASGSRLVLVRVAAGAGDVRGVLEIPYGASLSIRACFFPRDERRRRGACADQYDYAGTLTLDPDTAEGGPRFLYVADARTYPGRRSRDEDSGAAPPLRRSDLVWAADPACSYRRSFAWDAGAGRYLPDSPLPDCRQYFDF